MPCLSSALGIWFQSQEKGKGPSQLSLRAGKPSERFWENTGDPEVLSVPDREEGGVTSRRRSVPEGGKTQSPMLSRVSVSVPTFFLCLLSRRWPVSQRAHR